MHAIRKVKTKDNENTYRNSLKKYDNINTIVRDLVNQRILG